MLLEPRLLSFPTILEDVSTALGRILGLGLRLIRTFHRTLLPTAIRELGNTAAHVVSVPRIALAAGFRNEHQRLISRTGGILPLRRRRQAVLHATADAEPGDIGLSILPGDAGCRFP